MLITIAMVLVVQTTTSLCREPPPSLGDVRINNPTFPHDGVVIGEAQVYFTDGFSAPVWSSICSNRFLANESSVFCNQLGYSGAEFVIGDISKGDYPVWISELQCPLSSFTHIFHCDYTVKRKDEKCQRQSGDNIVVQLKCSKRFANPINTLYSGQVALCPPDTANQTHRAQSVSFGIVSLYFYNKWGALTLDSDHKAVPEVINNYRGNLICQQMGFQQVVPGSVQTLSSYKTDSGYTFNHCFTHSEVWKLKHVWITSENLLCQSPRIVNEYCSSTADVPCFSCCYLHPPYSTNVILPQDNYIVLQCMYDVYNGNYVPFGNKTTCSFEDEGNGDKIIKYDEVCVTHTPKTYGKGYFIASIIFIALTLILTVLLAIFCYRILVYYYNRRLDTIV